MATSGGFSGVRTRLALVGGVALFGVALGLDYLGYQSWSGALSQGAAHSAIATFVAALLLSALGYVIWRYDAELRLHQHSDERFNALVTSALEAIVILDHERHITLFNPSAERLFGYRAPEVMGRPVEVLMPERLRKGHSGAVRRFERTGMTNRGMGVSGLVTGRRADGAEFPVEASIAQFTVGSAKYMAAMLRDISDRVRAERETAEMKAHLEELVAARTGQLRDQARIIDQIREAVVVTDLHGKITGWSKGAEALYGYAAEAILGSPVWRLYPPKDRARRMAQVIEQVRSKGWFEAQTTEIDRLGKPVDVLLTISVAHAEAGESTGFIGVALDVSDRKRAEERLERERERLELALATSNGMVLDLDLREDSLYVLGFPNLGGVNSEATISLEEAIGNAHAEDQPGLRRLIEDLRRGRRVRGEIEYRLRLPTDAWSHRLLYLTAMEVDPGTGRPRRIIGSSTDITEVKRNEQTLLEAKSAADRANRAKSEFLSRMSHEMRTPLHAMMGFAQLLEVELGNGAQRESLVEIQRAGRHLLALISDLLDFSNIENGRLTTTHDAVDVARVIGEALALVAPLARETGVKLAPAPAVAPGLSVLADATRVRQVLVNLLGNAVKFSRPGDSVVFECEVPVPGVVRLKVVDTGPGIAHEEQAKLFRPFERLRAAASGVEGTGIGLALSSHLVKAMGGVLEFESEPGRGSAFWIELPRAGEVAAERAPKANFADLGADHRKVLYVEDNPPNALLMERIFERLPHASLRVASTGAAGLEEARDWGPDLVVLDLHLPDMQGSDVLQELRALPGSEEVPAIALTAEAARSVAERVRGAGFDAYVTKPIDIGGILETIDELLKRPRGPRAVEQCRISQ